ncbi:hypothetical protein LO762_23415 [Actinocorallia sp. API 0066]|uniref:hypothetical protein n=1 Tax=Actinocorallia sp. API 0066 TaxID=2896846 RepID=UPI001E3F6E7A|nr:hypothetical protein [Actinocorallia sp. API 0066]MCD0452117.1 hypothetical protein [Actinocorallia sp. API 0066]
MELLFEVATRARLLVSPLTTDLGLADGITFEEAVGLVLSASPVLPVLSDPDLAIVARVAERDPIQADELLAAVLTLREDLAAQAGQLGDARLQGQLEAAVTAAAQFDAAAHTLPVPDDDDIEIVIDVVAQQVIRVNDALAESGGVAPVKVVHRSILHALHTNPPAVPIPPRSGDTEPFRRAAEAEALIRLSAGDSAARNVAVALAGRLYWQDETLRQALEEETSSGDDSGDAPSIIAKVQVDHLEFSLGVSQGIGNAFQQALTPPSPAAVGSEAVLQQSVSSYVPLRPFGPIGTHIDDNHVYDPELGEVRELTEREKTIRNWGVGGFFVGWVGGATVGVIGTAPLGGAGGLVSAPLGGVAGTAIGMKLGQWKYDYGYAGAGLKIGEAFLAFQNPFTAIRFIVLDTVDSMSRK